MVHGLSSSEACGIFPEEGSNPLAGGFLTAALPEKSLDWICIGLFGAQKGHQRPGILPCSVPLSLAC